MNRPYIRLLQLWAYAKMVRSMASHVTVSIALQVNLYETKFYKVESRKGRSINNVCNGNVKCLHVCTRVSLNVWLGVWLFDPVVIIFIINVDINHYITHSTPTS